MSKRRNRPPDAEPTFAEAMRDVKPLAGRDKTRPPPAREPSAPPETRSPPASGDAIAFEIRHVGERLEGHAPGIDRRYLRRLRAGRVPVDLRIDLHGLVAREARVAVRDALLDASDEGLRCALVVHGRGSHSAGEPILKRSLPAWLAEPPLGARILAFASAAPGDGGSGATYVLLRRARRRNAP